MSPAPTPIVTPHVPALDDASLVRAARDGDRDAFRQLFDRHSTAIRGYLVARLGPEAADDVLVETFAAAWRSLAKFRRDADSARPWLYGIATIQAQRHRAAERRWQESVRAEAQVAACERPVEEALPGCSPALARGLAALTGPEREVLLLVALADMTAAMAARACGISAVAARMRLHRARRQLALHLSNDVDDGGTRAH